MGKCVKCQSERVKTIHTDGRIKTRCLEKSCGHVEIERYGHRHKTAPSETERVSQEIQG